LVVAKVIGHVPADMAQLAQTRTAIRDELKSQRARDRNTLLKPACARICAGRELKYHQDVIQRLVAQFHS